MLRKFVTLWHGFSIACRVGLCCLRFPEVPNLASCHTCRTQGGGSRRKHLWQQLQNANGPLAAGQFSHPVSLKHLTHTGQPDTLAAVSGSAALRAVMGGSLRASDVGPLSLPPDLAADEEVWLHKPSGKVLRSYEDFLRLAGGDNSVQTSGPKDPVSCTATSGSVWHGTARALGSKR
jgi:hypothetical protein